MDDLDAESLEREDGYAIPSRPVMAFRRMSQTTRQNSPLPAQRTNMPKAHEKTPLLRKTGSFSDVGNRYHDATTTDNLTAGYSSPLSPPPVSRHLHIPRRSSASSVRTLQYSYGGKSTFGQTASIVLLKIRMLLIAFL